MVINPNSRLGFEARICKEGSPTVKDSNTTASESNGSFWGVDVASEKLDLGCYGRHEVHSFENSTAGIAQLLDQVRAAGATLLVVEATGGYENGLVVALAEAGVPVVLVNPRQVCVRHQRRRVSQDGRDRCPDHGPLRSRPAA